MYPTPATVWGEYRKQRGLRKQKSLRISTRQMQRFQSWGTNPERSHKAWLGMLLASPPHLQSQRSSMEEATEEELAGVTLVQADSWTCLTVTLQQYNCTSITSKGNGHFKAIPPKKSVSWCPLSCSHASIKIAAAIQVGWTDIFAATQFFHRPGIWEQ